MASNLSRNDPTQFGGMNPTSTLYPTPPTQLSTETKRYYQSADRAKTILTNLDTAAKQSGQAKFGAGYAWLQQVASVMRDYGAKGGDGQTRTQQLQMLSALDPLMAEGKSETLSAYAPIAQALAQPFFSAGAVIPVQKSSTGQWIFGSYNAGLER